MAEPVHHGPPVSLHVPVECWAKRQAQPSSNAKPFLWLVMYTVRKVKVTAPVSCLL